MTQQTKDQPHWNDGDLEIELDNLRRFEEHSKSVSVFIGGPPVGADRPFLELREDIRQQQQQEAGACMAAVQATKQRPRRTWPGVLVARAVFWLACLLAFLLGFALV